jgi:hypothetical protein
MRIVLLRPRRRRLTGRARKPLHALMALALATLVLGAFHVPRPKWVGNPMAPGPARVRVLPPVPLAEQAKLGALAESSSAPRSEPAPPSPRPSVTASAAAVGNVPAGSALTAIGGQLYLVDLRGTPAQRLTQVTDQQTGTRLLKCSPLDLEVPVLNNTRRLFVARRLARQASPDPNDPVATSPLVIACRAKSPVG